MKEAMSSIRATLVLLETAPELVEAIAFNCAVADGRLICGDEEDQVYSVMVGEPEDLKEIIFDSLAAFENVEREI